MAMSKGGRPTQYPSRMVKTSVMLPKEAVEALKRSAKESGFRVWSEQLRYEILKPRGLYHELHPVLPGESRIPGTT